jgi:hypothetical protein
LIDVDAGAVLEASTHWLTYFRREPLDLLALASALQATIACLRAYRLGRWRSLGRRGHQCNTAATNQCSDRQVNRVMAKRDIMDFPCLLLCDLRSVEADYPPSSLVIESRETS